MSRSRYIAQSAVIAATYAAATLLAQQFLGMLAWGPIQLRLSEAITVTALFTPAAIPGLCLGSVVANLFMVSQFGPMALFDVVFGSLGTLLGAMWMWRFRSRRGVALAGPVVCNALIVPAYLPLMLAGLGFYSIPGLGVDFSQSWIAMYLFGVVAVGLGQAVVMYGLGWPLSVALGRIGLRDVVALDPNEGNGWRTSSPTGDQDSKK